MLAVIGDIHGNISTFKNLCDIVTDKYLIHRFIILGDFIDRGMNSKKVTDYIIELQGKYLVTALRGNHEDLLVNFIENGERYPDFPWHERVGLNTVASFMGITPDEAKGKSHWEISPYFKPYYEFFKNTKEYFIEETANHKFLFSHAGPAFFKELPENQYKLCGDHEKKRHYPFLWHHKTERYTDRYFDFTIVHGHAAIVNKYSTFEEKLIVEPKINYDNNGNIIGINIDTGCCYGGKLTAMVIDETGDYVFESIKCED